MARDPHIFQIGNANYTTREYCQSKGITDDYAIKKIQWRVNTVCRVHGIEEATKELIRLVSFSNVTQKARTHKACGEKHEPDQPCKPIDGIRPWQGTKKEREIALDKQSKWMEHNQKWLNEAGMLPNAEDIQKANKPYDPLQTDLDLQHAVKQYAQAIQRVDEIKLELVDAQKVLNEWHTTWISRERRPNSLAHMS